MGCCLSSPAKAQEEAHRASTQSTVAGFHSMGDTIAKSSESYAEVSFYGSNLLFGFSVAALWLCTARCEARYKPANATQASKPRNEGPTPNKIYSTNLLILLL